MIKDYKITGPLVPGAIYVRYEKGQLTNILFELTDTLNPQIYESFKARLKAFDSMTEMHQTFDVRELHQGRSVQDKIVMFCGAFKHYRGVPYKPKELEKANLKTTPVTRQLLDVFFSSPLANYTLDNYIKRINITRDWAVNGMNNHLADAFPDEWNEQYSRGLDGDRLSKYYQHLRSLGWKKVNDVWTKAVMALLLILLCACTAPKRTLRPRYESESNKKLNEWLDAEHPRKVVPTGEKKRKRKNR